MGKGVRYAPEFREKAVGLLAESRDSRSSGTRALAQVAGNLGVAPETLRRWRNQADGAAAAQSAQDALEELKRLRKEVAEPRGANDILTTASAFFRGKARPDTALMAAYIDEYRDRFGVGPIRRAPSAALDCGFVTPRGYRRSGKRPVGRTTARHEAPARDIMQIHPGSFMAVYGYRKMHARLPARGWTGIGRDQVARIMREPGIRGVRRGRTPVTTRPAKDTGGRPDLVERGFRAVF